MLFQGHDEFCQVLMPWMRRKPFSAAPNATVPQHITISASSQRGRFSPGLSSDSKWTQIWAEEADSACFFA
jgi:hypothetical protein